MRQGCILCLLHHGEQTLKISVVMDSEGGVWSLLPQSHPQDL